MIHYEYSLTIQFMIDYALTITMNDLFIHYEYTLTIHYRLHISITVNNLFIHCEYILTIQFMTDYTLTITTNDLFIHYEYTLTIITNDLFTIDYTYDNYYYDSFIMNTH